jgi:hypothetical protein
MDQLNVDEGLAQKFASYLETNDQARLAAIVPMTGHQAAQQDSSGN